MRQLKLIEDGSSTIYFYQLYADEYAHLGNIYASITIDKKGEAEIELTSFKTGALPPNMLVAECYSLLYPIAKELSKEANHKKEYRQKIDDFGGAKERDVDTKIVVETDKENIRIKPFSPLPGVAKDYVCATYAKEYIDDLIRNIEENVIKVNASLCTRVEDCRNETTLLKGVIEHCQNFLKYN